MSDCVNDPQLTLLSGLMSTQWNRHVSTPCAGNILSGEKGMLHNFTTESQHEIRDMTRYHPKYTLWVSLSSLLFLSDVR